MKSLLLIGFNYGWNNSRQFETPALGYWVGVYDVTVSSYIWVKTDIFDEPDPKMIKLVSTGTELISGHDYFINFFIRDAYDALGNALSNVVVITLLLTAP